MVSKHVTLHRRLDWRVHVDLTKALRKRRKIMKKKQSDEMAKVPLGRKRLQETF